MLRITFVQTVTVLEVGALALEVDHVEALVLGHVSDVDGGVGAALAADDLVVEVAAHVAVVLGLEEGGVGAEAALADVGELGHLVLLEAVLLVVVDVLEGAQAVLARVARRLA